MSPEVQGTADAQQTLHQRWQHLVLRVVVPGGDMHEVGALARPHLARHVLHHDHSRQTVGLETADYGEGDGDGEGKCKDEGEWVHTCRSVPTAV